MRKFGRSNSETNKEYYTQSNGDILMKQPTKQKVPIYSFQKNYNPVVTTKSDVKVLKMSSEFKQNEEEYIFDRSKTQMKREKHFSLDARDKREESIDSDTNQFKIATFEHENESKTGYITSLKSAKNKRNVHKYPSALIKQHTFKFGRLKDKESEPEDVVTTILENGMSDRQND